MLDLKNKDVFAKRRRELAALIEPEAAIILVNPPACLRTEDTHFPYRPNNDFYYMTGFDEPNAVMILRVLQHGSDMILFNAPFDLKKAQWDGACIGQKGACDVFGASAAYPIAELDEKMPSLLKGVSRLYFPMQSDLAITHKIPQWLHSLAQKREPVPNIWQDVRPYIAKMRLIKDDTEIACMQKAATVSVAAHEKAMRYTQVGENEALLHSHILQTFVENHCVAPAYPSIVGSGVNACTLHYTKNNAPLKADGLVLIDAGAEYQHYAADITRTFPVNGHFSAEQKAVYDIVLAAQLAGIDTITTAHTFDDAQVVILRIITQGLVDLGILNGNVDSLIEQKAYFPFYMHRSGHWLGLSVHDVGVYQLPNGQPYPLAKNMVLTVEPGIYISPNQPNVAPKWQGIGVRIEDDVLVTESAPVVLSGALAKTTNDIEAIVGSAYA